MPELFITGSEIARRVADRSHGGETIGEVISRLTDSELIDLLPYIRDENGEKVNLLQLKRYLREATKHD